MGRRYLPRGQGMFCLDDAKRLDRQPWQLDSLTAWQLDSLTSTDIFDCRNSKKSLANVSEKHSSDLSCLSLLNMKLNVRQKIYPTLKTSKYQQLRKCTCFRHEYPTNCPLSFKEVRPWNFGHMCTCPSRDLTYVGVSLFFFPSGFTTPFLPPELFERTYVYVHKCLKECKVINQPGRCTLWPPRLASVFSVFRCIDVNFFTSTSIVDIHHTKCPCLFFLLETQALWSQNHDTDTAT